MKATQCKHGHPMTGTNLIVYKYGRRTQRKCRICSRARTQAWRAANPAKAKASDRKAADYIDKARAS